MTVSDRNKASRIIADLRRDYTVGRIAELFGVTDIYITLAYMRTQRKGFEGEPDGYCCPSAVIKQIVDRGALMGARR